MTGRVANN